MSFFKNLFKSVSSFLGSKQVQKVEGQAAAAAISATVPAVKAGLEAAASSNPAVELVVKTMVEPAIDNTLSHIEQPEQQASS